MFMPHIDIVACHADTYSFVHLFRFAVNKSVKSEGIEQKNIQQQTNTTNIMLLKTADIISLKGYKQVAVGSRERRNLAVPHK